MSGTLKYSALAPERNRPNRQRPLLPPRRPERQETKNPAPRLLSPRPLLSPAVLADGAVERQDPRGHVRLRTRERGDYLHADDDGVGVSVQRSRASVNTAWTVHVYHSDGMYLLLHSAAYGRYLAATATPAPLGHRGFRAVQRNYDQPELEAIMWQVVGTGSDNAVLLRNVGGRYLRSNGLYLRWNTGVTVDDFENISTMMHWIVEPIQRRLIMYNLPDVPARVSSLLSSSRMAIDCAKFFLGLLNLSIPFVREHSNSWFCSCQICAGFPIRS